jgi:ribosome-binding protein aMBF1 (putative translation factor)
MVSKSAQIRRCLFEYETVVNYERQLLKHRKEAGRYIKRHRELLGLSLRDFAQSIGYDYTYLSKIENGEVLPGVELCRKLLESTGHREVE